MESTFWVSAIVQYDKTSKPCLCAKSDGHLTLDSAKSEVSWMVANYCVWAIQINYESECSVYIGDFNR